MHRHDRTSHGGECARLTCLPRCGGVLAIAKVLSQACAACAHRAPGRTHTGLLMKLIGRLLAALVAVIVIVFVLQMVASERGEVVKITTIDTAGGRHETSVWIVDTDGHQWIRSGSSKSGWFSRLKET